MDLTSRTLSECLLEYPNLRSVLGDAWIEREELIDPLMSAYALARWLRHPGYSDDLTMLDSVISQQRNQPHFRERKDRIRSDPDSLVETLTEMYFSAWVRSLGYQVEMTPTGPDFRIQLDDGSPLMAEVMSPRRSVWADNILERIDFLTRRYQVSAHLEYSRETLPTSISPKSAISKVVMRSLNFLNDPDRISNLASKGLITQAYPELGLEIRWSKPTGAPRVSETVSPEPTSEWTAFHHLADAASKKSRQLPRDHAGLLVFGIRQMPQLSWLNFMLSLQHYPIGDIPFDWSRLPDNVKHILFYSFTLKQIQPFEATLVTNNSSSLQSPTGFDRFVRRICPTPFRTD